jgi:hypothetical protein
MQRHQVAERRIASDNLYGPDSRSRDVNCELAAAWLCLARVCVAVR